MSRPRLLIVGPIWSRRLFSTVMTSGFCCSTSRGPTACFLSVMGSTYAVRSILNIATGECPRVNCWMTWICSSTV